VASCASTNDTPTVPSVSRPVRSSGTPTDR
jgi:hypothetical protein